MERAGLRPPGRARRPEQAAIDRLHPLVGGERPHVVRLSIDSISGRRVLQDPAWVQAHRTTNTWVDRDASDLLG